MASRREHKREDRDKDRENRQYRSPTELETRDLDPSASGTRDHIPTTVDAGSLRARRKEIREEGGATTGDLSSAPQRDITTQMGGMQLLEVTDRNNELEQDVARDTNDPAPTPGELKRMNTVRNADYSSRPSLSRDNTCTPQYRDLLGLRFIHSYRP